MSMRLQLIGMAELRQALRQLPEELTAEAQAIVESHAEDAARQVEAAYPEGPTGNLRRGVSLKSEGSRLGVLATLRSRAHHAHLYEGGTRLRRTSTGANRGVMPKAPEGERMIPIVVRARRRMVAALIQLVEKAGFQVVSS